MMATTGGMSVRVWCGVAALFACCSSDHGNDPPPKPGPGTVVNAGVECATDDDCSGSTPRCHPASHACAACLSGSSDNCPDGAYCDPNASVCSPGCKANADCMAGVCSSDHQCVACVPGTNDTCSEGNYCGPQYICLPGCKNAGSCTSGSCNGSHDCDYCVADSECADGHTCSTGQCLPLCGDEAPCPSGFTCCGHRCADTKRDLRNCGACGQACATAQYCGSTGCKAVALANACDGPKVTFLLDGLSVDDAVTSIVRDGLAASCSPAPEMQVTSEKVSGVVNPMSGQPFIGGGQMLAVLGGPFGHGLVRYLEQAKVTAVYNYYDADVNRFIGRGPSGQTDPFIVTAQQWMLTTGHDYFVVEMVLEPVSSTLVLASYGLSAPGTRAGGWYFVHQMLPMRSALDKSWYVYEWTDQDGDQQPGNADMFTPVASGP